MCTHVHVSVGREQLWSIFPTLLPVLLGGFLFGYDTGVVSGAMIEVKDQLHLTQFYHELVVAAAIGAAAVAAAIAGNRDHRRHECSADMVVFDQ